MAVKKKTYKKKNYKKKNYKPFLMKAKGSSSGKPESKFLDGEINFAAVSNLGSFVAPSLNLIQEGTGPNGRIGREVTLQSVHLRGYMKINSFNYVPASHYVRIIVYCDTECDGLLPLNTDIIANAATAIQPINGYYNLTTISRFVILKDFKVTANPASGLYNTNIFQNVPYDSYYPFDCDITNLNIPLTFTGTGATLPDIRNNNIGILAFSTDPAGAVNRLTFQHRIRYKDN